MFLLKVRNMTDTPFDKSPYTSCMGNATPFRAWLEHPDARMPPSHEEGEARHPHCLVLDGMEVGSPEGRLGLTLAPRCALTLFGFGRRTSRLGSGSTR